jgi:RimJ/RimL family protein N-acetyltransferase
MRGTPLGLEHFAELRVLHTDPRMTATLAVDGQPFTESHTRDLLEHSVEHWNRYGFGLWRLDLSDTHEFIGYTGIKHAVVENRDAVELAYAIKPEFWGKGLATEVSLAALKRGFEKFHIDQIIAMTLPHNLASRSVMEKCGFTYSREIVHAGLPHVLYAIESRTNHADSKAPSPK